MAKKMTHHPAPIFEQIKRLDENGTECWSARDLARVLDYAEYRNFLPVIVRAKEACQNSGYAVADHFVEMHEMITIDCAIFQNFGYQELGGTMPENLPTEDSIRKLEQKEKKNLNPPKNTK